MRYIDLSGLKYNRLTALNYLGNAKWFCLCDCGKNVVVDAWKLKSGHTKSCGCLASELTTSRNTKHGLSRTFSSEYHIWKTMRSRCNNPRNQRFQLYGARGIKVCERWNNFGNFLHDMGLKPPNLTLERKDNNGPYSPSNCIWATKKQQCRNKRNNVLLTLRDETLTVAEWTERLHFKPMVIFNRIRYGWTTEKILTTPLQRSRKNGDR